MAKVFFENRFLLTKTIHHQYCKETFKKMRKTNQNIALILAILTLVVAGLVFFLFNGRKIMILFGIIFLYFVMMYFMGYRFSEWLNYRNLKRDYGHKTGGEVVYQLKFEPAQVRVKVGETGLTFKYSTIEKVYETKDIFIFILSKEGMIEHGQIVFKNGFSDKADDTVENFKKYINEKAKKNLFETLN